MIARHWRGLARREHADRYLDHLRSDTFRQLHGIDGFIDAAVLRRDVPDGVEFLVVTRWESLDAVRRFAGDDAEVAVVPEPARQMLVDFDRRVLHYDVVDTFPT
ncbi:MAG: antibiotic biosynthesis monooxygenase [Acidobacteriota bacterium]